MIFTYIYLIPGVQLFYLFWGSPKFSAPRPDRWSLRLLRPSLQRHPCDMVPLCRQGPVVDSLAPKKDRLYKVVPVFTIAKLVEVRSLVEICRDG